MIRFFTNLPHFCVIGATGVAIAAYLIPCVAKYFHDFKAGFRRYELTMSLISFFFACVGLLIWCVRLFELGKEKNPNNGKMRICVEVPEACDPEGQRVQRSGLDGCYFAVLDYALHFRNANVTADVDWMWWIWKLQTRECYII